MNIASTPNVVKALAYGLGWVALAGVVGAVVGAIATGIPGIVLWSLSGIAVGAAQWAFVRRQVRISPVRWIAATAIAPIPMTALHLFILVHVIESGGYPIPSAAYAPEFLFMSVVIAILCGLILGLPQASALRDPAIAKADWVLLAILGFVVDWVFNLLFLLTPSDHWRLSQETEQIRWIVLVCGSWVALTLPHGVLIGRASWGAGDAKN